MSDPDDPDTLAVWEAAGFDPQATRDWIRAAPGRFTPFTALIWQREGFGADDAALWSEVYCDPVEARQRRSKGYSDPFNTD
jgi:hypothetical protein